MRNQSQNHIFISWCPLNEIFRTGISIETKSRLILDTGWGRGEMGNNGYSISFCSDENILKLGGGGSCTNLWIHF